MTQQLDERKITEALSSVATIDGSSNIVAAGAVSGIVIKDGHIGFTIEIDPKDKDKADQLRAAAEKAVLELDGALSATAMLTAHQSGPSMPTGGGASPTGTPNRRFGTETKRTASARHTCDCCRIRQRRRW
jgi:ATP-binding protein involved in chromosome partitioning